MRKITNREKVSIGFGIIVAIGILTYFFIIPLVKSGQSTASLETKQENLRSIKKLKSMEPIIAELENDIKSQVGYDKVSFNPRSAESTIMTSIAQIANQSEIREVEQLDVKVDKSKRKKTDQKSDQNTLKTVIDKLYIAQVKNENNNSNEGLEAFPAIKETDENETNSEVNVEENKGKKEEKNKNDDDSEQDLSDKKMIFPVIPKNLPDKVRQTLVSYIQTHDGKTLTSDDIDEILKSSDIVDGKETESIKKRLLTYSNQVKSRKSEVLTMINKLGIVQKIKPEDKIGKFSVKMVFKSDIGQLVKLLYNIQNSAKWIKIEGMNISVADRQKALLSVEIAMTASALYE